MTGSGHVATRAAEAPASRSTAERWSQPDVPCQLALTPATVLSLQRTAGNCAVTRLLQRQVPPRRPGPEPRVVEEWEVRRRREVLSSGSRTTPAPAQAPEPPPEAPTDLATELSGLDDEHGRPLVESITEERWQAMQLEAAAAAQRRERFEARVARDPLHFRPMRDGADGSIVGYWYELGLTARTGHAELRELLDVQGRVVQREVGSGAEVAEADPLDLIPFMSVARVLRIGPSAASVARGGARLLARALRAVAVAEESGGLLNRLRAAALIARLRLAGIRLPARAAVGAAREGALGAAPSAPVAYSRARSLLHLLRPPGYYIEAPNMSEARRWYRRWIRGGGREVGIFVHRPSGRIFVVQGDTGTVGVSRIRSELGLRDFDMPAHFHPPYAPDRTGRFPGSNTLAIASPSDTDLDTYMRTARATGQRVRARIHFPIVAEDALATTSPPGLRSRISAGIRERRERIVGAIRGERRPLGVTDIDFDPNRYPPITVWIRRGPMRGFSAEYNDVGALRAAFGDIWRGRRPIPGTFLDTPPRPRP